MNKAFLIGNLTRDPELTQTTNGIAVCRFSIAVQREFTNSEGERDADFFNIVAWRNTAENCNKYLKIKDDRLLILIIKVPYRSILPPKKGYYETI